MSGNFPSGFDGFQARMEATIEICGGDHLARMAVERVFRSSLESAVRKREHELGQKRPFEYPRPHLGYWLTAQAQDFDLAAKRAAEEFEFDEPPLIPVGEEFAIVWGGMGVARAHRRGGGIMLASRRREMVAFSDAGVALARSNGISLRSHYRHFRSAAAAKAFLPRLAKREFRLA